MARYLFCRCGAVYDVEGMDSGKLYKCRECESILSPEHAVEEEERTLEQEKAIPKSGLLVSLVLIIAFALLGVAIGAFKVKGKLGAAKIEHEKHLKKAKPVLDEWEQKARKIKIVDKSEERASKYMDKVFSKIARARDEAYPAIVRILCITANNAGTGSGALIIPTGHGSRREGYIVTNQHVAGGGVVLECTLSSQETAFADLIYADPMCDVAVIKLKDPQKVANIKPAKFADSDKVKVGDFCMAMGAPQGLGRSISFGIISGINRFIVSYNPPHVSHRQHNFFQMDAPINQGNSGGPLVNIDGRIIGMNTLGALNDQRTAYAIMANYESEIVDSIVRNKETSEGMPVERSRFGLDFTTLESMGMTGRERGAPVLTVHSDSPAFEAGIRPGDVIVRVKNMKTGKVTEPVIHSKVDMAKVNYLFEMIESMTEYEVTWQDYITGEETTATMRSEGFPAETPPYTSGAEFWWGCVFGRCTDADLDVAGFNKENDGGETLMRANFALGFRSVGFQRGDIIRYVDGVVPRTPRDIANTINRHISRDVRRGKMTPVIFEVIRGNCKVFIELPIQ